MKSNPNKGGRPAKKDSEKKVKFDLYLTPEFYDQVRTFAEINSDSISNICVRGMKIVMADWTPKRLDSLKHTFTGTREKPADYEEEKIFTLRLLGGVAAGDQMFAESGPEVVVVDDQYPPDHYALRVFGASMEPKVPNGSVIVVRPQEEGFPKKGTIVVYSDRTGSSLKEFGYRKANEDEEGDAFGNVPVLRSINKAFKDVETIAGGKLEAVLVEVIQSS